MLGLPATGSAIAELWLGAHPDSPAGIVLPEGEQPLDAWLADDPASLGERSRKRFGDRLPYLLKVLAAEKALSLQVHPTAEQAERGFAAEEAARVPRSARERRYKDPFHKPEMILAVTDFDALCGLRPVAGTVALLDALALEDAGLRHVRSLLDEPDEATGLRRVFEFALSELGAGSVAALVDACGRYLAATPAGPYAVEAQTVLTLDRAYPGDPGIVVALMLNRLTLSPGEALYLPAGNVHAYLHGTGIEVMATSDNVLRAGLTPKYVDVPELMSVVDFTPAPQPYVVPEGRGALRRYRAGAAEFELAWVCPSGEGVAIDETDVTGPGEAADPGPRVVLCLSGSLEVSTDSSGPRVLAPADAVFVPATEHELRVGGTGTGVVVGVPA